MLLWRAVNGLPGCVTAAAGLFASPRADRLHHRVGRVAVVAQLARQLAWPVLRCVREVGRLAVAVEDQVRPLAAREREGGAVCVLHGVPVRVLGVAPRDARVGPLGAVAAEGVAAARVEPPLVLRPLAVHVVEDGVEVAIGVGVEEGVLSAHRAEVGRDYLRVVLHVRAHVLPVGGVREVTARAVVVPRAPDGEHRAVWQDERRKVGVRAVVVREDLLRRGPRALRLRRPAHERIIRVAHQPAPRGRQPAVLRRSFDQLRAAHGAVARPGGAVALAHTRPAAITSAVDRLRAVRGEVHDVLPRRRARHHRLVREDVPHHLHALKLAGRVVRHRADDARVLRPRADAAMVGHLGDPHVILSVVVTQNRAAPAARVLAPVRAAVACAACQSWVAFGT
eukprot:1060831-Prymnesium_polylepis.1